MQEDIYTARWWGGMQQSDYTSNEATGKPTQYYHSGASKSNWLNRASGKYRALTCLPPKYRPSSSLTVFHAPAGPANNTKIRTASLGSSGTGYTG